MTTRFPFKIPKTHVIKLVLIIVHAHFTGRNNNHTYTTFSLKMIPHIYRKISLEVYSHSKLIKCRIIIKGEGYGRTHSDTL